MDAATDDHTTYMRLAIAEAENAGLRGDLAVGSVLVLDGEVIGAGANAATTRDDFTAHAEIEVLRGLSDDRLAAGLENATLYTTFEPCPMCMGAIFYSRIGTVVIGGHRPTGDQRWGGYSPQQFAALVAPSGFSPVVIDGPLEDECRVARETTSPTAKQWKVTR
ncbi:MAG: nucleoside deaminase [Burkholderiaceae bacterium]|nr:nucleoside deaminase [Microbacteriaceae bacterium]